MLSISQPSDWFASRPRTLKVPPNAQASGTAKTATRRSKGKGGWREVMVASDSLTT